MKQKYNDVGGVAFVGCLFIGMGLGIYYNQTAVGTLIGLGAGFIAMALIKSFFKR